MKYYVMPKNEIGQQTVISKGIPCNMDGVIVVELPKGDYLKVISKGKEYPAYKIALAISHNQIKIEDIEEVK